MNATYSDHTGNNRANVPCVYPLFYQSHHSRLPRNGVNPVQGMGIDQGRLESMGIFLTNY